MFELFNQWWTWYRNSGLDNTMISVPLVDTTILFAALTICLLFRFPRLGLILAYLFIYRWGWSVQVQHFTADPNLQTAISVGYLVFGILVFTFTVVGMLHSECRND